MPNQEYYLLSEDGSYILSEDGGRFIIEELAVTLRLDVMLNGVDWTAVADDLLVESMTINYGIGGRGPLDLIASTGTLTAVLRNRNPVGRYSPGHIHALEGWDVGIPIRAVFAASGGGEYVKFRGIIQVIDPQSGIHGTHRVHVAANDYMGMLAEAEVSNIVAKVNKTDKELLEAVYNAIPAEFQPPAIDLDDSIDTYPYAFDQVGPGDSAMALLQDVLVSTLALLVQTGDGTHKTINRQSRTFTPSVDTFTGDDFSNLSAPSDRSQSYDRVVVEIPQIVIGTGVEVLASEVGVDANPVPAGETIEKFLSYRDPNDTSATPVPIAGTSMIAPTSGGGDILYNAQADGLGANLTAGMVVTADFFSGAVKLTIENTNGVAAYRITLRTRGTAIRRFTPILVESGAGLRTFHVVSPFQDSVSVAQFQADIIKGQLEFSVRQPLDMTFMPAKNARLLRHALEREPGDRITLNEEVTGLGADAIIHSISLEWKERQLLSCRWTFGPQNSFLFIDPWRWGNVGESEWGETTVYA